MRHFVVAVGLLAGAGGAGLFGVGSAPALAQTNVERFERQLERIQREQRLRIDPSIPAGQRALFDYGGYLTLNFLAIDDIQQNTHILRQYDLVGYGRLNIDNVHEFFLRARTSYRDFNSGDSFDGEGDELISPTVEQAFYRFDLARYLSAYESRVIEPNNLVFTGGRQFVYWANGLVLAETLDGATFDIAVNNVGLQLLAGVTQKDAVDFDSSRPDFDDDTRRGFYGATLSAQLGRHRPYVYGLIQRDYNDEDRRVIEDVLTRYEYDSHYLGVGMNGSIGDRLLYATEFVYQGGEGLSNSFDPASLAPVSQTEEDIEAWAADIRLDYLLADRNRTRLSFETILASGDDDRLHSTNTFGGNRSGTDDRGFNAFGLLNTGLAFAPSVSNLAVFRVGASTFPIQDSSLFRRFQVGADLLFFTKLETDAPIDEPTEDHRYLGFEPDIYLNWQLTSDVTLAIRYGVFFPGTAIENDEHPRHFFFTGLTFAF